LCHASDATNQDSRVSRSSIPNAAAAVLLPRTVTSRDLSSPRDVVGLPTLATVCRYRPTACQQTLNFVTIVRSTLLFTTDATALAASHSRLPAEVTSRRHGWRHLSQYRVCVRDGDVGKYDHVASSNYHVTSPLRDVTWSALQQQQLWRRNVTPEILTTHANIPFITFGPRHLCQ